MLSIARFVSATVAFGDNSERKMLSEVAFMVKSGESVRVLWVAFEINSHANFHV